MNTCAWCRREIPEDAEVFGVSGKFRPGVNMKDQEGKVVPLVFGGEGRVVPAIITPADSPAKRDGKDLMFMLCSEKCCNELAEGVRRDMRSLFEAEKM